jgi:hypothetical protein
VSAISKPSKPNFSARDFPPRCAPMLPAPKKGPPKRSFLIQQRLPIRHPHQLLDWYAAHE